MSVENPNASSTAGPDSLGVPEPTARRSASYLGCRHCEEGNLVYDPDAGASRCRSCGELDR